MTIFMCMIQIQGFEYGTLQQKIAHHPINSINHGGHERVLTLHTDQLRKMCINNKYTTKSNTA